MKSFSQYLAEAGIQRKKRVAAAAERATYTTPANAPHNVQRAVQRTALLADRDVKREEAGRRGRVVRRAETEAIKATADTRPSWMSGALAAVGGHRRPMSAEDILQRRVRTAEIAQEYGEQMAFGGKPRFAPNSVQRIKNAQKNPLDGVGSEGV